MYNLIRSDFSGGASGICSLLLNGTKELNKENQHPKVGFGIWVGDFPGTGENWWKTNFITEIVEESKNEEGTVIESIFRTASGSLYTWSIIE